MNNKIKIFKTQDGSLGLYDIELNEVYHSKFGAKTEAFEKFIEPCLILNNKPLKILDICYGIGYNTKTALLHFKNIELIDCVDINKELVLKSAEFDFDKNINEIIKQNLEKSDFIHFYFDDIRKVIKTLDKKYDIIFHDGFASYKQPQLWSEDLIKEIISKMHHDSIYCTYNHAKPVLAALYQNNLFLGKVIKNSKTIATTASFNKDLIKNPLNEIELSSLKTKSAITYKDKNLNLSNEEIIKNRKKEIENSKRETLSHFIKNLKNKNI